MDLLTHALSGGVVGLYFGHIGLGVLCAVLPDLTILTIRRLERPPKLYKVAHSFLCLLGVSLLGAFGGLFGVVFWSYASHLLLDLFTHGGEWSVSLDGDSRGGFHLGKDWEFFNVPWLFGFLLFIGWFCSWLILLNT